MTPNIISKVDSSFVQSTKNANQFLLEAVFPLSCFNDVSFFLSLSLSLFKISFDLAEYTANVDGVGTLRLLDAIKTCGLTNSVKFYQASTSELYGKVQEIPQKETTPFYPRSPYGKTHVQMDIHINTHKDFLTFSTSHHLSDTCTWPCKGIQTEIT